MIARLEEYYNNGSGEVQEQQEPEEQEAVADEEETAISKMAEDAEEPQSDTEEATEATETVIVPSTPLQVKEVMPNANESVEKEEGEELDEPVPERRQSDRLRKADSSSSATSNASVSTTDGPKKPVEPAKKMAIPKPIAKPAAKTPMSKFEAIHNKAFKNMDSIAHHYAAKRMTPSNAGTQPEKPVSLKRKAVDQEEAEMSAKKSKVNADPSARPIARPSSLLKTSAVRENVKPMSANKPVRPKFDLKASLARPLTYKPYTGKLKNIPKEPAVSLRAAEQQVQGAKKK